MKSVLSAEIKISVLWAVTGCFQRRLAVLHFAAASFSCLNG